ncbi:hypothetical protein KJ966_14775 [bacterium]|nr:hypothetical protein [bacterium]
MKKQVLNRLQQNIMAVIVIIFGIMTVIGGGRVLFPINGFQQTMGAVVPFVVWFNFLAGFFYIIAGFGFRNRKRWAVLLSLVIFLFTCLVFVVLMIYIYNNGEFELRTVYALIFRSAFWGVCFYFFNKRISKT